jgi:Zn(II)-responsive transcriptional regulator
MYMEVEGMENLKIGQLAKKAKVKVETVRYYERRGLLPDPSRRESGYRMYSETDVTRLQFIRHAQKLGFTLNEVSELLSLRVDPGITCADVKKRAEIKLNDIEGKIRALRQMKLALTRLVKLCKGGSSNECSILQALNSGNFESGGYGNGGSSTRKH